MKRLFVLVVSLIVAATAVSAQTSDNIKEQRAIIKERKEMSRLTKKQLNARVAKTTKDAMKTFKKEGWKVAVGALPLEKQLDRTYNMLYEFEAADLPRYIMGEATAISTNYDAAKMQALELAKINLAGMMQTEITALVESTVSNQQISSTDAVALTESVMSSKNLISQSLGRVIPVIECYRTSKNGMTEVRVQIAYSYKAAAEAAKSAMKAELEKKGQDLHEQLDKVLGF